MYSKILDEKTLGAVIAAAPQVDEEPRELARRMVAELVKLSEGVSVTGHWQAKVGDLALWLGNTTAHQVGRACREMGLGSIHTRDGYQVVWNQAQIDILVKALGVEDGR